MQIIIICGHRLHSRNDCFFSPISAKDLCQFLKIGRCSFPDREYLVPQPFHAEVHELFFEKLRAELLGQERDILNDCKTDTPLLIFGQFNNGRQECLR